MKREAPRPPDMGPDLFEAAARERKPTRARARHTDPSTCRAAASRVNGGDLNASHRATYEALRLKGPTCDEDLQTFYDQHRGNNGWPIQRCVRKRRHDLVEMGYAEYTGRRVPNPVGQSVMEWRVVDGKGLSVGRP